jgi:preprotein translocase subunit SecE
MADENEDSSKTEGAERESAPDAAASNDEPSAEELDAAGALALTESSASMGHQRFVYAGYLSAGVGIAFLATKVIAGVWHLIQKRSPQIGDPHDEFIYPVAILIGLAVPLYYYRKQSARQYVEEVAEELSKVTWPSKNEVINSTTIVVVTTLVATVFFALLDQFWRFVTDKVYGI